MTQPTVSRIVHYTSYGTPHGEYASVCCAAVVTGVYDDSNAVDLAVLNRTGMFFNGGVPFDDDDDRAGGTWHWPERS